MARYAIPWFLWWLVLAALWLLLVGKVTPDNQVAAAVTGALAASVTFLVIRLKLAHFRPKWEWLRVTARIPGQALSDTGLVFGALWRQMTRRQVMLGRYLEVPFDAGGDDAESAARRALVTLGISLSPNTYVVFIDRNKGNILLHQLIPTPGMPGHGDRKWPL